MRAMSVHLPCLNKEQGKACEERALLQAGKPNKCGPLRSLFQLGCFFGQGGPALSDTGHFGFDLWWAQFCVLDGFLSASSA